MATPSDQYVYRVIEGWGRGSRDFQLGVVRGVAVDANDRVYVCQCDSTVAEVGHSPNRRFTPGVAIFDRDGRFLSFWGNEVFPKPEDGGPQQRFVLPHGIWISPDQRVYVTDEGVHTVWIFTTDGKLLKTLGTPYCFSDSGYAAVVVAGLPLEERLKTIRRGAPPFNQPTGVMEGPSGAIYVSDGYGNARVHKFSPEGRLLLSWGEPGQGPGQFNLPHHVWVDEQERVYVTDRMNHRIQIFDHEGNYLSQWTDVVRPQAVLIDPEGAVFIVESGHRITVMTQEGEVLTRWGEEGTGPGQFSHRPHCICRDSKGDLYIGVGRAVSDFQKFTRAR